MMKTDLHIHTTASDGRLTPLEILNHAIEVGLNHISITDHDTVDGLLELHELGYLANKKITIITGIEFSTDLPLNEVHILGYNIDIFSCELQKQLDLIIRDRWDRVNRTIEKLTELGYAVEFDRIVELAGNTTSIGRPHIARALVEKGYFPTVTEVFNTLLYKNGPAYVPHYKLSYTSVIKLIEQSGGISVLAHPGLVEDDTIVDDIINSGINGIEVYHPRHNSTQIEKYLELAKRNNLIVTGGSDFHGIPSRFPHKLGVFTSSTNILDYIE
ncbi:PHP domain-containing protein [Dendrosporobacter sp. 1207_IL3150]|uniref:PHP domain-containing protein n=1 Tax=Dendrosporobacter sp. 1207_IL3150 TaxID=3084054 RepID=UPI002FDA50A4